MPVQHSPSARQTRSQARAQADLTQHQECLLMGPHPQSSSTEDPLGQRISHGRGRILRTTLKGPGEDNAEEENSVEEKGSYGTKASPTPVGESQGT
ncbi:hypothetical protein O181_071320 [Austropuccinia psidii MF-1]|uniref:Uncharacterized protein n=1 Tax=Austropuccinia psidii MF-1 TaxID=1389203 RepID=A0A9Q3F6H8_9BASI|nr:hypothetical protein [Austropuccinia psidii MF-1]